MKMINNQSHKKCVICGGLGHRAFDEVHISGLKAGAKYYKCSLLQHLTAAGNNAAGMDPTKKGKQGK